jgi:hypothetical protein
VADITATADVFYRWAICSAYFVGRSLRGRHHCDDSRVLALGCRLLPQELSILTSALAQNWEAVTAAIEAPFPDFVLLTRVDV